MRVRELKISWETRTDLPSLDCCSRVNTPRQAASFLLPLLAPESVEVFVMLCLSTKQHLLAFHEVSRGSLDSTVVHPREVFKAAILANAASIVVAHCHPSGDVEPSPDDIALTQRLVRAGELIGITLADHLVIGDGRYYSFKEAGRL